MPSHAKLYVLVAPVGVLWFSLTTWGNKVWVHFFWLSCGMCPLFKTSWLLVSGLLMIMDILFKCQRHGIFVMSFFFKSGECAPFLKKKTNPSSESKQNWISTIVYNQIVSVSWFRTKSNPELLHYGQIPAEERCHNLKVFVHFHKVTPRQGGARVYSQVCMYVCCHERFAICLIKSVQSPLKETGISEPRL